MSKRRHQLEATAITLGEIDKAYTAYQNSKDLFEQELSALNKQLSLAQVISLYSILREELSVLEYDFTIGSLREDDA